MGDIINYQNCKITLATNFLLSILYELVIFLSTPVATKAS